MSEENKQKDKLENRILEDFKIWIGVIGAIVSSLVALWATRIDDKTAQINADVQRLNGEIENQKFLLQKQKEDIARYEYVRSLYEDLISTNKTRQQFTINLVQLALNDEEYKNLFTGLSLSPDESVRDVGESALALKEERELQALQSYKIEIFYLASNEQSKVRAERLGSLLSNFSESVVVTPKPIAFFTETYTTPNENEVRFYPPEETQVAQTVATIVAREIPELNLRTKAVNTPTPSYLSIMLWYES
jgi:hypothetical protein